MMTRFGALGLAVALAGGLSISALARSTGPPPVTHTLDSLRLTYPSTLHTRDFSSCRYSVTGVRAGVCVHGIVIASYPLKRNPELGASGASFRPNGVLFELYRAPRQEAYVARAVPPSLSLTDFRDVGRGMNAGGEQRELFFRAKGANYRALVWIGKRASESSRGDLTSVIGSIQIIK